MKTLKLLLQALLEWIILVAVILIVSWVIIQITMKQRKTIKVSKDRAIIIASNHNNIPIQKAKEYTDSELREVLRHLNLKPGF